MQTVSRLINDFVPEHYQLSLNLDRINRRFSGTVIMKGDSSVNAKTITVHAKDLTIESVTVDGTQGSFAPAENDELIISYPEARPGQHIVVIAFNGTITDAMHGLYPCYYDHDGQKKELLATQFESHHAREVFPCIDEPEAKATFDVTLTTEADTVVLGNMPVKSQTLENELLVTSFDTTPRMSTYLLAWVTGELHKKTAHTKSGVEVNIWATPAQPASSLDFALDIATRTIDFFDDYFGVPYPLPKSDHVALPDFSSGAMENWGLITYREVALLADPATTSVSSKHFIATVIAHELSHQWFGNLVTMKWWNNLWLNESFATLMEYIAIDALHPEWNIWLDFSTAESIAALRRDSIDGVQAVQVEVNHPDEISTLFDGAIVYAKGGRLLRMLQHYVGNDAFRKGLQQYFTTHAYSNTEGEDLWKALGDASGKDIAAFMNTWISQSGYPVLHVSQDNDLVTLTQEQFFTGPHQPSTKQWPLPLVSSCSEMPELLDTREVQITRHHETPLRFNVGDTAHFVTHYSPELLARLIEEVQNGNLDILGRLQLLHEQTLLARGGMISTAELLPLLPAYKDETTEAVWDIISLAIGELKKFVEDDKQAEQALRRLSAELARSEYTRLGWTQRENENEQDTKLRATIIAMMLYGEDSDAIATAKNLYENTAIEALNPELRSLIIGAVVRHHESPELISNLLDTYRQTSSAELQQDIASGLTSTRRTETISALLARITDTSFIRTQDTARWVIWLLRNRDGRTLTWNWLRENWDWIEKTFAGDKSYDDYPRYSAGVLTKRSQLDEYREFFMPLKDVPALSRVIAMGIVEIEGRVELLERDGEAVRKALLEL
jgi:aminopeptidase N